MTTMTEELPLCECGCGGRVSKPGNRFVKGHNVRGNKPSPETILKRKKSRKENKNKPKPEPKLCSCGCGGYTLSGNECILGHSGGKKLPKLKPTLCKCGCGFYALSGNDYIAGHHRIKSPWKPKIELKRKPCECGCGELALPGNEYIHGHQNIGRNHSVEMIEKTKIGLKNNHKNHPEIWEENYEKMRGGHDIINHHYIYDHSDLLKYTMKITRKKHTLLHHWMKKSGIKVPHINIEVNEDD